MRARNLKPSYFKNEVLGRADPICGHIFQGLWGLSDREGRLERRLDRIHIEINPYRDIESTRCAIEWLIERGFVVPYEVGGRHYLFVRSFLEHNHPHVKEPPSKLPPPPDWQGAGNGSAPGQHQTSTGPAPGQHQAGPVQERLNPESGILNVESGMLRPEGQEAPSGTEPERRRGRNFDELRRAAAGRLRLPGT